MVRPLRSVLACEGGTREGNPSIHRAPRPPRHPSTPRRPGAQPALVLARAHPGPLRLLGTPGPGTPPAPAPTVRILGSLEAPGSPRSPPTRTSWPGSAPPPRTSTPICTPPLVPGAVRRPARRRRLLLARVRRRRGPAPVLRRPRHPRRRPPQGRQRPRRPPDRRRTALPARLLPPVPRQGRLAAGAVPRPRPRRAARHPAPRARRHPARVTLALPGGRSLHAHLWTAQVGRVPLLMLDSDVEENAPASAASPTASTAAAASTGSSKRCCSASAASAPSARTPGSPATRPRGLPHQRGPRRLPRPRTHP